MVGLGLSKLDGVRTECPMPRTETMGKKGTGNPINLIAKGPKIP